MNAKEIRLYKAIRHIRVAEIDETSKEPIQIEGKTFDSGRDAIVYINAIRGDYWFDRKEQVIDLMATICFVFFVPFLLAYHIIEFVTRPFRVMYRLLKTLLGKVVAFLIVYIIMGLIGVGCVYLLNWWLQFMHNGGFSSLNK